MDSADYVGEESYLFYDIDTACLRITDGTPGGRPACIEGAGGAGGVEAYPSVTNFPALGEEDVIYIAEDTNLIYRWDGVMYVPLISPGADDNVQSYPGVVNFPTVGLADVIYIDTLTDSIYYWNGSVYQSLGTGHETAVVTIPASSTITLYATTPTGNLTLKFILSTTDTVDGRFTSSEVLGSYKQLDDSVKHNHYGIVGDNIAFSPKMVYLASDVQLNIKNNEANPITVRVSRIPTLPL